MIADLLVRLDEWLFASRPDYYAKLQAGARPEDLDAFEKRFQVQLSSDFRELYQWRNGQDPNYSANLQKTGCSRDCKIFPIASKS
jgi:cell wall assembly regulator SMI1